MGAESQVAVFIDYDNIQMSVAEVFKGADVDWHRIMQEAGQMGRVVLRRAYADWAEAANKQRDLLSLGVELIHMNSKRGKNAADIRIVLDAMELLYNEQHSFTHVLLVSGDGDFTELVHRLRANGKVVVGMGVTGASKDFLVTACDQFIFYDKLPNISKQKAQKNTPAANNGLHPKQRESGKPAPAAATTPEGKLEQYTNLLGRSKIRITPSKQRPMIIYKLYEIIKANPDFTFNDLKEFAQAYFENAAPQIEPQMVLDTAHQLFHTFCFEFDPESHERIWNRKLFFSAEIETAEDLLNRCDRKIMVMLGNALGSIEKIDLEVMAHILYGGSRSPKAVEHLRALIA